MRARNFALGIVGLLLGCSSSEQTRFSHSANGATGGDGGSLASTASGLSASTGLGSGVGGFAPSGGTSTGSGSGECSEASKLVYVVSTDNQLYSFSPATLQFKLIGIINCFSEGTAGQPFSMAVDRSGTAWVLFNDGQLFGVDTANASCKKTAFIANQNPDFFAFGMGFASDDAMGTSETLYVAAFTGSGLGKIDFPSMKLSTVGPFENADAGELTGTGDGRLFGFFISTPVTVSEIDKKTGGILSVSPQPTVNIGGGWAFAFWGGDFWLFTSPNSVTSQVDRYQPSQKITKTVSQVNFKIVGAGVSTCAPVEVPK